MNWVLYAVIHSLSRAFFVETNRVYRIDAWTLTFWQAMAGTLILMPVIPFMAWPTNAHFYFAAVVVAGIMAIGYMIQLGLVAKKMGRVSGMHMTLEAVTALLVWTLITPTAFDAYADDPVLAGCIVLAVAIMGVGLLRIRPGDISWETFSIVAPVGLTYAIAGITTKLVIPEDQVIPAILTYVFVNFATMTVILGTAIFVKKKTTPEFRELKSIKAGMMTGVFSTVAYTTFVCSVVSAPNPGYVSTMAMLLPVWLYMFHRVVKVEDKANPLAACLLLAGAVILVGAALLR